MTRDELVEKIKALHQAFMDNDGINGNSNENNEIIALIEAFPEAERDDEIIGFLARAYNNDSRYLEAIKLLNLVKEENRDDIWLYRMGYSLHFLAYDDENKIEMLKFSQEYFKQIKREDPDAEELMNISSLIINRAEYKYNPKLSNQNKIKTIQGQEYIELCEDIQRSLLEHYDSEIEKAEEGFEKDMLLLYRLEVAMANGGFMQLVFNWGVDNFNETGRFLERINAEQHLNLLVFFAKKFQQVIERDDINDIYDASLYMKRHENLENGINAAYWELEENLFELICEGYQVKYVGND